MSSWNPWSAAHNAVDSVTAEACRSLYVFLSTGHIMDRYSMIAAKQCSKKRQCWPNENIRKHGGAFCLDWDTLIPKNWMVSVAFTLEQVNDLLCLIRKRPSSSNGVPMCRSWTLNDQLGSRTPVGVEGSCWKAKLSGTRRCWLWHFCTFAHLVEGWCDLPDTSQSQVKPMAVLCLPAKALPTEGFWMFLNQRHGAARFKLCFSERGSREQNEELVRYPPPEEEVLCRVWHLVVKCGACEHHQAWRTSLHIYVTAINSIDMQLQKHHPVSIYGLMIIFIVPCLTFS